MSFRVERSARVIDNESGECIAVGANDDFPELVSVSCFDVNGGRYSMISMSREEALEVNKLLSEYIADDRNFVEEGA